MILNPERYSTLLPRDNFGTCVLYLGRRVADVSPCPSSLEAPVPFDPHASVRLDGADVRSVVPAADAGARSRGGLRQPRAGVFEPAGGGGCGGAGGCPQRWDAFRQD